MKTLHPSAEAASSVRALLERGLTEVIDTAIAITGADFGNVQVLDQATSKLRIVAQRGFPDWWLQFWDSVSVGEGSCGTVLESWQRVIVEDVEDSPVFADSTTLAIQRRAGVRAVQSTPLIARCGTPLGVFSTHYKQRYRPDERSLQLLDLLARHASDLIERALADKARTETEEKYATVFQSSPLGIALSKWPEGSLIDVNDACLALFELTHAETIGRTVIELGIADQALRDRIHAALIAHGSLRDLEYVRISRSTGARRVLSLHFTLVSIGGAAHVLTESVDVTEQRAGEFKLRELTTQLTDLNRELERRVAARTEELLRAREVAESASKAKSDFLSSMSHEIRTPLNSILGFAQLLRRDKKAPLNTRQLQRLDHVLKSGEHLLHLVDDVLDLSRIEAGRLTFSLEPIRLDEVLREVDRTLTQIASESPIRLVVEAPPQGVACVVADRRRLAQVLINYGSNAIKYGKEQGRATISTRALDADFVRITVTDNGIGIPQDKQSKIFQPFERAGQESGTIDGTGIGLTIAKRLADAMKARVGFNSVLGEGSSFWIDVPAHNEAQTDPAADGCQEPVQIAPEEWRASGQRKILYVEDNPSNVALIQCLVEDLGQFTFISAPSAEAGLELILREQPDVVLMDINLPGMSGIEAMRQLRQRPETARLPVIALTAAAMPAQQQLTKDAGFYHCLTKPIDVAELITALEVIFDRC